MADNNPDVSSFLHYGFLSVLGVVYAVYKLLEAVILYSILVAFLVSSFVIAIHTAIIEIFYDPIKSGAIFLITAGITISLTIGVLVSAAVAVVSGALSVCAFTILIPFLYTISFMISTRTADVHALAVYAWYTAFVAIKVYFVLLICLIPVSYAHHVWKINVHKAASRDQSTTSTNIINSYNLSDLPFDCTDIYVIMFPKEKDGDDGKMIIPRGVFLWEVRQIIDLLIQPIINPDEMSLPFTKMINDVLSAARNKLA